MMPDLTLNQKLDTILDKLSGAAKRVYDYEHTSFAVKDLDTVYTDIVEENPELASKSAIGFTALLNSGETVSKQGNRMFIYGKSGSTVEEETAEFYQFSGENSANGTEFVIVWYFANDNALTFSTAPSDILIASVVKRNDGATLNINTDNFNFVKKFICDKYYPPTTQITKEVVVNEEVHNPRDFTAVGSSVKSLTYNSRLINGSTLGGINSSNLVSIDFPNLEEIYLRNQYVDAVISGAANANVKFNKLKRIDTDNPRLFGGVNSKIKTLYFPDTLISVVKTGTSGIFDCVITDRITLNCNNLESMPDNWCTGNTPPAELIISSDWGCSIRLDKVTPVSWDKTNYIDLFTNKLRNMTLTDETRTLKIPTAIYNALTTEEIAIATAKGWTITHP